MSPQVQLLVTTPRAGVRIPGWPQLLLPQAGESPEIPPGILARDYDASQTWRTLLLLLTCPATQSQGERGNGQQ